MATAIPELIASVLQTRLQQVTVANGYEVTVSEVVRPTRESDIQPKDNQIIFSLAELTRTTELDCQGNPPAYAWTQSYNINAVIADSIGNVAKHNYGRHDQGNHSRCGMVENGRQRDEHNICIVRYL